MLDTPQTVRKGEELPLSNLENYFQKNNLPSIQNITQFPSGFSNLTYCIHTESDDVVLRRAPFGADAAGGHNMEREFRISSGIHPFYSKIPKPIHFCSDPSIIGGSFYLMERVKGMIIRKSNANHPPHRYAQLSKESAIEMARIHHIPDHVLPDLGRPTGYVSRQIQGWIRRHHKAKIEDSSRMNELNKWLTSQQPADQGSCIIHNDYKFDNLVLHPENYSIMSILDWEMCTRGCPLMDLGVSLGYWLEGTDNAALRALPFCPTHLPGNLNRYEFLEIYAKERNIDIQNPQYYMVYGVWRLAIILEQIYKRYVLGHTQDSRFAGLGQAIPILVEHAHKLKNSV